MKSFKKLAVTDPCGMPHGADVRAVLHSRLTVVLMFSDPSTQVGENRKC